MTRMPDGTGVLLDLKQEVLLSFNATGALIVDCIEAGLGREAIVERVTAEYEIDPATAGVDVDGFVRRLHEAMNVKG